MNIFDIKTRSGAGYKEPGKNLQIPDLGKNVPAFLQGMMESSLKLPSDNLFLDTIGD
jgi:hypothetical protein